MTAMDAGRNASSNSTVSWQAFMWNGSSMGLQRSSRFTHACVRLRVVAIFETVVGSMTLDPMEAMQ